MSPTNQAYAEMQTAYEFFNRTLFDAALPDCLITMQRRKRTYGYFCGERFGSTAGETADEIAMNPVYFATRSTEDALSTLVHEMAHLWQHHFGTPPRRCYHNKEWARKMRTVGLIPSNTGEPGGKETGQQMTHYIEADGRFAHACQELLATGLTLTWSDRAGEGGTSSKSSASGKRVKFICSGCEAAAWGKPDLLITCGVCVLSMDAVL